MYCRKCGHEMVQIEKMPKVPEGKIPIVYGKLGCHNCGYVRIDEETLDLLDKHEKKMMKDAGYCRMCRHTKECGNKCKGFNNGEN